MSGLYSVHISELRDTKKNATTRLISNIPQSYSARYMTNLFRCRSKKISRLRVTGHCAKYFHLMTASFLPLFTVSRTKPVIFLLCNNLFIYQVLCTLIYRRRSLYSFLFARLTRNEEILNDTDKLFDIKTQHNRQKVSHNSQKRNMGAPAGPLYIYSLSFILLTLRLKREG